MTSHESAPNVVLPASEAPEGTTTHFGTPRGSQAPERTGCFGRPATVCVPLTGPQVARLTDIRDELGVTLDETARQLLLAAMHQWTEGGKGK